MTESGLTATTQDATLGSIIDKFDRVSGLPVVGQENQVLGVITRKARHHNAHETAIPDSFCRAYQLLLRVLSVAVVLLSALHMPVSINSNKTPANHSTSKVGAATAAACPTGHS